MFMVQNNMHTNVYIVCAHTHSQTPTAVCMHTHTPASLYPAAHTHACTYIHSRSRTLAHHSGVSKCEVDSKSCRSYA